MTGSSRGKDWVHDKNVRASVSFGYSLSCLREDIATYQRRSVTLIPKDGNMNAREPLT